jgi:small redox-active disulfide protein 2
MKFLQILGTGCPKCNQLAAAAESAAKAAGIEYHLEKVTDIDQIMRFGVMVTPALVVDGLVKVVGRIPTADELRQLILAD